METSSGYLLFYDSFTFHSFSLALLPWILMVFPLQVREEHCNDQQKYIPGT